MTLTKQEIADLKELLANTHSDKRSGKTRAYEVAAYMRDKGWDMVSKIIEMHEAVLDAAERHENVKDETALIAYMRETPTGYLFGRILWTLEPEKDVLDFDKVLEIEKNISETENEYRKVLVTSISYL